MDDDDGASQKLEEKLGLVMVEVGSREWLVWPDEIGSPQHGASPHVLFVCAFIPRVFGTVVAHIPGWAPVFCIMEGVFRNSVEYSLDAIVCSVSD